jgi:hypothetical protein
MNAVASIVALETFAIFLIIIQIYYRLK